MRNRFFCFSSILEGFEPDELLRCSNPFFGLFYKVRLLFFKKTATNQYDQCGKDGFCGGKAQIQQVEPTTAATMYSDGRKSFVYKPTQPSYSPSCPKGIAFADYKPTPPPSTPDLATELAKYLKFQGTIRNMEEQLAILSIKS